MPVHFGASEIGPTAAPALIGADSDAVPGVPA